MLPHGNRSTSGRELARRRKPCKGKELLAIRSFMPATGPRVAYPPRRTRAGIRRDTDVSVALDRVARKTRSRTPTPHSETATPLTAPSEADDTLQDRTPDQSDDSEIIDKYPDGK